MCLNRYSRYLSVSWTPPSSPPSMAADSMEIDDSLYRQVTQKDVHNIQGQSSSLVYLELQIRSHRSRDRKWHFLITQSKQLLFLTFPDRSLALALKLFPPVSLSSRQRYVLGDSAMHQMAKSSVFLSGMGGLGIEIGRLKFTFLHNSTVIQAVP